MVDIATASLKGIVRNVTASRYADANEQQLSFLSHGQQAVSDIHGKWFETNLRGALFAFNVTAQTIPVITAGLVSVFTLYNPPGSNVVAEIVDTEIGQVVATTVVDAVGWYSSTAAATAAGTFTTKGTARSGQAQGVASNKVLPYSAYTHSGTPAREDIIGSFGATTNANSTLPQKFYDGRLLLPQGIAMSVAMSTAAGFTSGLDISARWVEWPV